MTNSVLICTVGGSHQPILTAIQELAPIHVLFFATGHDPATGRPGSLSMITGKGEPIEVRRGAEVVERLANIPTLAGLTAEQFTTVEVPADDLDGAASRMLDAIGELRRRIGDAEMVADYTGGTKTMTAALVMVALDFEDIDLQLVTGSRADLVKVHDGSQSGLTVTAEGIRLRRAMAPFVDAWQRFAYAEAAEGLARLRQPRQADLRAELQIAKGLSVAFDAWDRFDHLAALEALEIFRARVGSVSGEVAAQLFTALKNLTAGEDDPRCTPARLWDLWLNAQRRAAQGRFDDAVARAYRLVEWTAQWFLAQAGVDTTNLGEDQIPEHVRIAPNSDGKRKAGLLDAWRLAAHHCGEDVGRFVADEGAHLLDHLKRRNHSILAHGSTPVSRSDWERFSGWLEASLLPLYSAHAKRAGIKTPAPQLPRQPLWRNP